MFQTKHVKNILHYSSTCQLPVLKVWLCVSTSHVDCQGFEGRQEVVVWNISGVASSRSLKGRRQQKEISLSRETISAKRTLGPNHFLHAELFIFTFCLHWLGDSLTHQNCEILLNHVCTKFLRQSHCKMKMYQRENCALAPHALGSEAGFSTHNSNVHGE